MGNFSLYEHADALAMAVRLHEKGKAPEAIDRMLGLAVVDLVDMSTRLLVKSSPGLIAFKSSLFSHDVQCDVVASILMAFRLGKISTADPKRMVNCIVKASQNLLRNAVRNATNRRRKADVITENRLGVSTEEILSGKVTDLYGNITDNKTTTNAKR